MRPSNARLSRTRVNPVPKLSEDGSSFFDLDNICKKVLDKTKGKTYFVHVENYKTSSDTESNDVLLWFGGIDPSNCSN